MMKSRKKNKEEITGEIKVKKKKKHKKTPIVIAVAVVAFIIFRAASCAGGGPSGIPVVTTSAVYGDLQESISISGTVCSEDVKVIFAPVSGTLAEVNVTAGDAVKEGDLLIGYDMDKMERALRQSALQLEKSAAVRDDAYAENSQNQAKLNEANINLDVLNRQIEDNKAYLKDLQTKLGQSQRDTANALAAESYDLQGRLQGLTPGTDEYNEVTGAISRNAYLQQVASSSDYVAEMQAEIADVQERIAGYEEYKARMEAQKTSGEAAVLNSYDRVQIEADNELAGLSYQETEEEYYIAKKGITAQFDGIVTECSAIPGAGVSSGMQLMTLESSRNVKVTFNASKYDLEKLALGQKADAVISGQTYQGEISRINRMAVRNESNTPMVGVEIHLLNADDHIILGMDAKLTIYTNKAENALLIPVEAVNADREGDFLYLAENGIVVKRPVVCGISSDAYIEIKEGLTQEDAVILSAASGLEEGMAVIVMPGE